MYIKVAAGRQVFDAAWENSYGQGYSRASLLAATREMRDCESNFAFLFWAPSFKRTSVQKDLYTFKS